MATSLAAQPFLKMSAPDFRHDLDLAPHELHELLELAGRLKRSPDKYARALSGHYLALLFEKPSLRTRFTFELAIQQLGGGSVSSIGPIGDREPLKDMARNIDRWTQCIVARVFDHATIEELAHWSSVPVINALSDLYHPCQALADVQTLQEHFGRLKGLKLAYVGDGNNVAHSLLLTAGRLGVDVAVASPAGYMPNPKIVAQAQAEAAEAGARITVTHDASDAVQGAHCVYADVWASMGQESEADQRKSIFAPYQVNAELMSQARQEAIFLHCLPAKRGQEVTDEVIESKQSAVFDQAENRLHAQKALLLMLLS